jgi:hypothetical protein
MHLKTISVLKKGDRHVAIHCFSEDLTCRSEPVPVFQQPAILNRVEHYKSFVYGEMRLTDDTGRLQIDVKVRPRANGRPICSGCHRVRPGYDRLPARRFEFVPLWAIPVFFVYAMRRVNCPQCGVTV